ALAGIAGVERVTSTSENGGAEVEIEFASDHDELAARMAVHERLSAAQSELPEGAEPPILRPDLEDPSAPAP
ncbi:MAG: efflux RND transporter permease subunit, partial [Myxococcales bacterium]|nr:efflux RND transporter permease subunit [Myxococcales bacterium]